jgi:predicted RNA-binding Zn-ribbon protein involved in translation (DUF1610 family)
MHVRVCPQCGDEYRPEIVRCADCGCDLQDRHADDYEPWRPQAPREPADALPPGEYRPLSWGERAADLVPLADRLVEAGIPFRFRPRERAGAEVSAGFELCVRDEEREAALDVLAAQAAPTEQERRELESGTGRCPACQASLRSGAAECPECGLAVGDVPEDE